MCRNVPIDTNSLTVSPKKFFSCLFFKFKTVFFFSVSYSRSRIPSANGDRDVLKYR